MVVAHDACLFLHQDASDGYEGHVHGTWGDLLDSIQYHHCLFRGLMAHGPLARVLGERAVLFLGA